MSFRELELKPEYRSRRDNVIDQFYNPLLSETVLYKRAVGFFSSSALNSFKTGILNLIRNGGRIQIITSPRMSGEDILAIEEGFRRRQSFIKTAKSSNFLSELIATKKLEIKIALLETGEESGMFHEKLGLLYDDSGNVVAFSGSMNESANAFFSNYEAIDVFTSWSGDAERVYRKQKAFNAMWENCEPGIQVLNFWEVKAEYLRENQIVSAPKKIVSVPKIKSNPEINLREYQKKAVENWAKNSYVGIFDMATGSGKTYTAIAGMLQLHKAKKSLAAVIVCPYKNLVEQWADNLKKFEIRPQICHSEKKNWQSRLKTSVLSFNFGIENFFCAVMTEATFAGEYVQTLLKKLKGNALLVVDEAHRFGAESLSQKLPQNIKYRLALSATIERNDGGTERIYNYFGAKVFEYPLQKAIEENMLTPYYYNPVVVSLDDDELEKYLKLTAKIAKNFHAAEKKDDDHLKILLAERARIVAGAKNKIEALRKIISNYKDDNQILIYCGAAKTEEARQIDVVTKMLGNELDMRVKKFTCKEKAHDREMIKANFAEGKNLQALVAIRCLDEGVDIPSVKTAFILSSSDNPREYIQRRGRLLRKSPGKKNAVIFDFVTLPVEPEFVTLYEPETLDKVKALVQKELARVKEFSALAENPFFSDCLVADIQKKFSIFELKEESENVYD